MRLPCMTPRFATPSGRGSSLALVPTTPTYESIQPPPTERQAHLIAQFRSAQLPAILAMDDLLSVLKRSDCDPANVLVASEAARATLDRLWSTAARVTDLP